MKNFMWSHIEDAEYMIHDSAEDAAAEAIEEIEEPVGTEIVTVYEWKSISIDKSHLFQRIYDQIENVYEEEYSNENSDPVSIPAEVNIAIHNLTDLIAHHMPSQWFDLTKTQISKTVAEWKAMFEQEVTNAEA